MASFLDLGSGLFPPVRRPGVLFSWFSAARDEKAFRSLCRLRHDGSLLHDPLRQTHARNLGGDCGGDNPWFHEPEDAFGLDGRCFARERGLEHGLVRLVAVRKVFLVVRGGRVGEG